MDGFITIVVLVIAFNLLNRLLGAAARKKQPQPRRSFRAERPIPERPVEKSYREPSFFKVSWPESSDYGYDGEEEDDQQELEKRNDTGDEKSNNFAVEKKASLKTAAVPVSNNLRDLLSSKDSLLAAFIFHEAISKPPLSCRRKRQSRKII